MFASIVVTAVTLHLVFAALGITPESARTIDQVAQFALDYTFWLNLLMVMAAVAMVHLHH